MDVAGMTAAQADEIRRAFSKPNNGHLIAMHRRRFLGGAWQEQGVPEDEWRTKIFAKINGQYMFPESHSHAFAVTAYQAAWLKRYHRVEFFVTLLNNQPMGFYPVETLKQDARCFGVPFLNPCVNRSGVDCAPCGDSVLLGLRFIKNVGAASAQAIVEEREGHGPYAGAADLVRRAGLKSHAVESPVITGAFDSLVSNRQQALWEAGLGIRPGRNGQRAFSGAENGDVPDLPDFTAHDRMAGEYRVMGIYPRGHLMEFVRPGLDPRVLPAAAWITPRKGRKSWWRAGPSPASIPRGRTARCSSPSRTRPGTPS